jgi:methyl-accepting chemotaxis protein
MREYRAAVHPAFIFSGEDLAVPPMPAVTLDPDIKIMLSRLRLRAKLAVPLGLSGLAVLASIAFGALELRDRMTNDRVEEIRAVVQSTVSIARGLEAEVETRAMTRDQAIARMREIMHLMRYDNGTGYITATGTDGITLIHGTAPAREGKLNDSADSSGRSLTALEEIALRDSDEGVISYLFPKPGGTQPIQKLGYAIRFAPWNTIFLSGAYTDDLDAAFQAALARMCAVGGVILVLSTLIAWLLNRDIGKTLASLGDSMARLAGGDLAAAIPGIGRKDELGGMARAMLIFRENAEGTRRLEADAERVRLAKERRQAAMDQHVQDFGTSASGVMTTLVGSADLMRKTAGEMTEAARQTLETATRTARNADSSAQNLGAVAAAAEEMTASIQEISQQASRATHAAHAAVGLASTTDAKVGGMAEAVERVGNVVRLISDIAGRTNLLALNATIEAARAGEAGKGFAVVAGEVKALAAQTAKATDEITSQIAAIRVATGEAVQAVREVNAAIGQISEVATAIAAAVEQQSATTREIAFSVQTVTAATQEAGQDMRDVSTVSGSAEAASRSVVQSADEVGGTADILRTELAQFLAAISRNDEADRRRYDRLPGSGAHARLTPAGGVAIDAEIVDISRSGVSLRTDWWSDAGTEVSVLLSNGGTPVLARTARTDGSVLALAFRQDDATLRRVDTALEHVGALAMRSRAA